MIEIGIENGMGTKIIDTLVTWPKPWRDIYAECDKSSRVWLDKQKKKFRFTEDWEFPAGTKTMNAREVAECLSEAGTNNPSARFVEYTTGNLDLSKVRRFLASEGVDWVLGDHRGISLIPLWRRMLPGYWDFSQTNLFEMLHPAHELVPKSHRAMLDAKKLHIICKDLFDHFAED